MTKVISGEVSEQVVLIRDKHLRSSRERVMWPEIQLINFIKISAIIVKFNKRSSVGLLKTAFYGR